MWQTVVFSSWWWLILSFLAVENVGSTTSSSFDQSKGAAEPPSDNLVKWIILCVVLAVGLFVVVVVIFTVCCCCKKKMNKLRILDAGRRTELGGAGEYPYPAETKTRLLLLDDGEPIRDHVLFSKKQETLEKGDGLSSLDSDSSKTEPLGEDSLDEERPRQQKTIATYTVEYWMATCPRVLDDAAPPLAPYSETSQFNEAPLGYSRDERDPRMKLFLIDEMHIPLEKSKEMEAQAEEAVLAGRRAQQIHEQEDEEEEEEEAAGRAHN